MDALDGNAIAGLLVEVFGAELTTATGTCAHCGATGPVAELEVYLQAPGTVVRCRSCSSSAAAQSRACSPAARSATSCSTAAT